MIAVLTTKDSAMAASVTENPAATQRPVQPTAARSAGKQGSRALQGIGGAVISPASLAIIATSFAEGRERSRALGVWGAMGGVGGSLVLLRAPLEPVVEAAA
jgi:MFS family permease